MKNFFVVRLANKQDGTVACPVAAYETEPEAQKEFFRLCGQAVDSVHLRDSVALLTAQGFELKHETFEHEPIVEEPEPTEEEPEE